MEARKTTKYSTSAAELRMFEPIEVILNITHNAKEENNGNFKINPPQQSEALIRMLISPRYNITTITTAHIAAITSNSELIHALDKNTTVTDVIDEMPSEWSKLQAIETLSTQSNTEKLALILARNRFLSQPENQEHLLAFQSLMNPENAKRFTTALAHQYPQEFDKRYKAVFPATLLTLDHVLKPYEKLQQAFRNAQVNPDANNDFLLLLHESIEDNLGNNSKLIVETLLHILKNQPQLLSLQLENKPHERLAELVLNILVLNIISLLIRHANEDELESIIAITDQLIDKIALSKDIADEEKQTLLTKITNCVMDAALNIQRNPGDNLISTHGKTASTDEHQEEEKEEKTDQQESPWQNTLEKIFQVAKYQLRTRKLADCFTEYQYQLIKHISQSTNSKALDLMLRMYAKAHQQDKSFHFANIKGSWIELFSIIDNKHFTLAQKRLTLQMVLHQQEPTAETLLLRQDIVTTEGGGNENRSLLSLLIQQHADHIQAFIEFAKGLPLYGKIRDMLLEDTRLINEACLESKNDEGALVIATVAVYSALGVEVNIKETEKTTTLSYAMKTTLCSKAIESGIKLNLLNLLLINKTLSQTMHALFDDKNFLKTLIYADNDNYLAGFIQNHILSYSNEKKFDDLWEAYTTASLDILKTTYKLSENGDTFSPKALSLLPAREWVEIFFNLSSPLEKDERTLPGLRQPKTIHNSDSGIFQEIALPYALLALGMYFKSYDGIFTYANRATAFINNVDVLINTNGAALSSNKFSDSTFNRLYLQLPKTPLNEEKRKATVTLLYEFCLSESNCSAETSRTNFQKLVIQPLLEKLSPLFAKVSLKQAAHQFSEDNPTLAKGEDSRLSTHDAQSHANQEIPNSDAAEKTQCSPPAVSVYNDDDSGQHLYFEMANIDKGKAVTSPQHSGNYVR